ncbi:hypothetical protein [Mesorhizobium sp. M0870]|uniref:hypothetical protein n=1 Tax=Mesorhizobium sp. M0870 TaxID=2957016 RepID=UPI0033368039
MNISRPDFHAPIEVLWEWADWRGDADFLEAQSRMGQNEVELGEAPAADASNASGAIGTFPAKRPSSENRLALTVAERRAVTGSAHRRARKERDSWWPIMDQLATKWVSRDFRRVIARLIEANVLHDNGKVPYSLDRDDTKRHMRMYRELLRHHYGDRDIVIAVKAAGRAILLPKEFREKAYDLVALDLCMEEGGFVRPSEITDFAAFAQKYLPTMKKLVRSACENDGAKRKPRLNESKKGKAKTDEQESRRGRMSIILDDVRRSRLIEEGEEETAAHSAGGE